MSKTAHIKFNAEHEQALRDLAKACGHTHGEEGNLKAWIEAIAQRDPATLDRLWLSLSLQAIPPPGAIAAKLATFIEQRQPFEIRYQDAAGRQSGFIVRYAAFHRRYYKPGVSRTYLECWCDETNSVESLKHNWTLRLDDSRYAGAEIMPASGEWQQEGLATLDVTMVFTGGLAAGYEGHADDVSDSGKGGDTRTVCRQITSTHWFFREILPYQALCQIVAPNDVRDRFIQELERMRQLQGF